MWFEKLTGLTDDSRASVQQHLRLDGTQLTSAVNGRTLECGRFELPSLAELRQRSTWSADGQGRLRIREVIGDVQHYHVFPESKGALFQAASQFNMLEMVAPSVLPEAGIASYEYDRTQGPACAIACGAGTIYRNYFVPIGDQLGQTEHQQLDGLSLLAAYFENEERQLWQMRNGYALANRDGLRYLTEHLNALSAAEYEALKGRLQLGIQWDTEVTISPQRMLVSQIYCSALPVAYSQIDASAWEAFARLVLSATYEATFYAALENAARTGNSRVYLTLVGGGAFGNREEWLLETIVPVLKQFASADLEVIFVSYGQASPLVWQIIDQLN
ncbi:MAG: hypothetical protein AAGJ82_15470 [Bacteroidota bacterium]